VRFDEHEQPLDSVGSRPHSSVSAYEASEAPAAARIRRSTSIPAAAGRENRNANRRMAEND